MIIALAAGAAAWVLLPLFRANDSGPPRAKEDTPRAVHDAAHAALRDFELDYATGKISAEDYQFLRPRYEGQANATEGPGPSTRANASHAPASQPNSAESYAPAYRLSSAGTRAAGRKHDGDAGPDTRPTPGGRPI